jgi:hypothetical protein
MKDDCKASPPSSYPFTTSDPPVYISHLSVPWNFCSNCRGLLEVDGAISYLKLHVLLAGHSSANAVASLKYFCSKLKLEYLNDLAQALAPDLLELLIMLMYSSRRRLADSAFPWLFKKPTWFSLNKPLSKQAFLPCPGFSLEMVHRKSCGLHPVSLEVLVLRLTAPMHPTPLSTTWTVILFIVWRRNTQGRSQL